MKYFKLTQNYLHFEINTYVYVDALQVIYILM